MKDGMLERIRFQALQRSEPRDDRLVACYVHFTGLPSGDFLPGSESVSFHSIC